MSRVHAEPNKHWSTYLTPGPVHRRLGLFCLGAGEGQNPPEPSPERALGCHAAVLLRSGHGALLHSPRRQLVEVRAPAVLWLFPGVLHGYRPAGAGWTQAWVLFDGPATAAYGALGYLDPDRPVLPLGTAPSGPYGDRLRVEKAFAQLLDLTPQELILGVRLNEAKALLTGSTLTIATIAHRIGYDDPAYFSRLFTTRVGQSPRTFRTHGAITAKSPT
ncbi:helix-turn-helix transcriptional regulator [Kribbella sp. NBC_01245]|uniref:helix-turn-helix transcriptional regulator n=1 Tax=Kribbella sp. NBC_01245 TaxID=2903578 RepID=UPI002E29A694|nr:helix-turn-helix transcriptional regulator [Kribbella sp. NBC_01245]